MVLSGKSITQAQLHGYNHKTKSKVCCTYIRFLYALVLLSIDFPLPSLKLSVLLLTVLLSGLMTVHSFHQTFTVYQDIAILPTKSPDWTLECTFDWILDSTIDCIVTNYIMTNCNKIQHNFLRY